MLHRDHVAHVVDPGRPPRRRAALRRRAQLRKAVEADGSADESLRTQLEAEVKEYKKHHYKIHIINFQMKVLHLK